ncbi:MAG: paraquat-inducible protein A [Pseudomonadota bacterium]
MTTARDKGFALCRTCGSLTDKPGERCVVCGTPTQIRNPRSLQLVWAFLLAGIIAYIPGNLMPIMITQTVSGDSASTIMGGVIALIHHKSYAIAAVIFIASILVPVSKFIVIAWLALSIQFNWNLDDHKRHFAHEAVEFIGRWSMIDVFVVAALAALIQVGGLMSIIPGPGVDAFAMSVIFTMFSAMSLDPRLIWDKQPRQTEPANV